MTDLALADTADTAVADAPADAAPQDGGWTTVTDPKEAAAATAAVSKAGDGQPVTLSGADFLASKDPGYAAVVKAIAEGRRAAPSGMALRTPYGQRLAQDVYQYDPTADDANLPARVAVRKAFTADADGRNTASLNTTIGHAFSMAKTIEMLHNSRFPTWNAVANAVGNQAGDAELQQALARFRVDKNALTEEAARSFKGGNPDVHGAKGWEQIFDENAATPSLRSGLQEMGTLLESRVNAQEGRYNQGMGTTSQGLPLLTPHAHEGLSQLQKADYLDKGYSALTVQPTGEAAPEDHDGSVPPAVPPVAGGGPPPPSPPPPPAPPAAPAADAPTLSADGSSDFVSSRDKQYTAAAQSLFANPQSTRADFDALANQYGNPKFGSDLDQAISYRNKGGEGVAFAPPVEHHDANLVSAVANSAIGSGAIGLADTGSLGLLPKAVAGINAVKDRLTGDNRSFGDVYANDLADAHARMGASEAAHPYAALAGQAAGFITGDGILGRIPGLSSVAGKLPSYIRPAIGDALTGAAYGAGSQDSLSDVPGAALKGGLLSAAGGALGRGLVKGVGAVVSPVANDAVRRLTDAGITLTPGQILGAQGGLLGKVAKATEDRLAGFPVVGDVIQATRRGSNEDFVKAATNDALAPIGAKLPDGVSAGHDSIAHAQQAVSDAYDSALAPIRAAPDEQFAADLGQVAKGANTLSATHREQFANYVDSHVQPYVAGRSVLDGSDIQAIKQGLDSKIGNLRGQGSTPQDRELADSFEGVRDAVLNLAGRADPANAAKFQQANQAYSMLSRVQAASAKAKDGVFTPNQFRQAVTKRGYGTTTANVARGSAPMQQLATDASTVLPSTVPDSGTAGRQALGLLAGGGVLGGAEEGNRTHSLSGALTGALAGSALLSRPGARAFQGLVAGSRGKTLNTLGAVLRRNAALGGAVGAPLLLAHRGN